MEYLAFFLLGLGFGALLAAIYFKWPKIETSAPAQFAPSRILNPFMTSKKHKPKVNNDERAYLAEVEAPGR